jgi:hypothetical protein
VLLSGGQEEGAVLLVWFVSSSTNIFKNKKIIKTQKDKKIIKYEYTIRFSFALCWRLGK